MKNILNLGLLLLTSTLVHLHAQTAPGGVSTGLNYWLKADAGITSFPDTVGGVPVDRVSQWANQVSGSVNSISGIQNFERPVFIENGLNFNPALNFDGNNDFLRTDNGWDSHSVIIVFNPTEILDTNTGVQLVLVYDIPNNAAVDSGIGIGDLGAVSGAYAACSDSYFFNSGDRNIPGTGGAPEFIGCSGDATTTSTDDAVLAVVRPNTTETAPEHKLFGEDQITTVVNPAEYGVHADRPFTIGQRHAGGFFYEGDVLEAISYSSRVSDADILKIESYLAIKYGLTLSQTASQDYISSLGTSIYDSDDALNVFNFNIAGIGRDDASGLHQKQSMSTTTNSVQTSNAGTVTIGLGSIATTNAGNTNSFSVDQSFSIWGNNAASTAIGTSVTIDCGTMDRMDRVWAIQETGNVEDVEVRIPQSFFSANTPTLIISDDVTFDENDILVVLEDDGSGNYAATVDFTTGIQFFSFGESVANFTEYNGIGTTGWTNGVPTATSIATISTDYDTVVQGTNITACSLTVNDGATLSIGSNQFAMVENNIQIDGNLFVAHEGSLVQTDIDATVTVGATGTIDVQKITTAMHPRDFAFMSSPVSEESRNDVYDAARKVIGILPANFTPDPAVDAQFPNSENFLSIDNTYFNQFNTDVLLTPGEGYLVFPAPNYTAPTQTYDFTYTANGLDATTLNSGTITRGIDNSRTKVENFNLLGNPYPSGIDLETFLLANNSVSEVYLWEHNTVPNTGIAGYLNANFSMEDFTVCNAIGCAAGGNVGDITGPATTTIISSGQGFAIKAEPAPASATVTFTNNMRTTTNNTFRSTGVAAEDRLWLKIENEKYELYNQTLIAFDKHGMPGIDRGYDTNRMATAVNIFTTPKQNTFLAIQTRELFQKDMTIALGYSTVVEEKLFYTISIDHIMGRNVTQYPVYLYDALLDTYVNLKEKPYKFQSNEVTAPNRFVITFEIPEVLGTRAEEDFGEALSVYPNPTKDSFALSYSGRQELLSGRILDVNGQTIKHIDLSSFNGEKQVNISGFASGVYFLYLEGSRGVVTKKLIVK